MPLQPSAFTRINALLTKPLAATGGVLPGSYRAAHAHLLYTIAISLCNHTSSAYRHLRTRGALRGKARSQHSAGLISQEGYPLSCHTTATLLSNNIP